MTADNRPQVEVRSQTRSMAGSSGARLGNNAGMGAIRRAELLRELDALVNARLFGPRPWLADRESGAALSRKLEKLGLQLRVVEGDFEMWRTTALGKEQHLDLLMVFAGMWDEWEMPDILEEYGLIDEANSEAIFDGLGAGADPESVLLTCVRKAYADFYNPSGLRS